MADGTSEAEAPAHPPADRSLILLLVVLAAATPVLLHAGRHQWFFLDEWDFLIHRDLGRPTSLLDGWFGHNVVLPAVVYRAVVAVWGVSSYRPFQLLSISSHFGVVLAVRGLARQLGVRGWVATAAVVPLVFLGSGRFNILFGFQITLTGALALTLLHLQLADGDGPWSRRDTVGVLCGAAALLCSGVAVAGTIGVGVSVLLRRGPAMAARHTIPLGLAWGAWSVLAPDRGSEAVTTFDRRTIEFLTALPKAALGGLADSEPVALGLGLLAVIGVAHAVGAARLAARRATAPRWWAAVAPLAACVTTAVVFGTLVAVQRLPGEGQRAPTEGRYVYVLVALVVPLLALGVEAVVSRRRLLVVVPLALLVAGMPGNVRKLDDRFFYYADKRLILALANTDQLEASPPRPLPFLFVHGLLTIDDLRAVAALPGLPDDGEVPPESRLFADVVVGLAQGPLEVPPDCRTLRYDVRRLEPGDTIDFIGAVTVHALDGVRRSLPAVFEQIAGARLTASGHLRVEVVAAPYSRVYVCPADDAG